MTNILKPKKNLPSSQASSSSSSCLLFLNDLSPAWPSSRSICACPCSVITSPILINATTTTRWLSFGLEKCTPPGVRRFHVSPSERARERERLWRRGGRGVGVGGVSQWDAETQQMLWDRLQNKRGRGNALVVWLEQPWGSAARRLN